MNVFAWYEALRARVDWYSGTHVVADAQVELPVLWTSSARLVSA